MKSDISINFTTFDPCLFSLSEVFDPGYHLSDCPTPVVHQSFAVTAQESKAILKHNGFWFLDNKSHHCRSRDLRVVIVPKDRPQSLPSTLLKSLNRAVYKPLLISIDLQVSLFGISNSSDDANTMGMLSKFRWLHGFFEVKKRAFSIASLLDVWPCEQYPEWLYEGVFSSRRQNNPVQSLMSFHR